MPSEHRADWEWGWKTPLLFRFPPGVPRAVSDFLATPFTELALDEAAADGFAKRIADLRTSRIGFRFERVQEALFRAHPDTESLRANLAVPGRTEIDLLHRLRSLPGAVIHWEVAVKFYLGLDEGGSSDADRFIGPSLRDTLGIKTRAIFGRQLPILGDADVRARFGSAFGILPADRVLALPKIHGILFHPYRGGKETRRPEGIAEDGLRGAWTSIDRLRDFLASSAVDRPDPPSARVRFLADRREWIRDQTLVSAAAEDEIELKSFLNSSLEKRIQSHFAESGGPIQCAIVGAGRAEGETPRDFRCFVVPANWPDAAERGLETLRAEGRIKG